MQLLIFQQRKYPKYFPDDRWTCMNSIYNQMMPSNIKKFQALRARQKVEGNVSKNVDWGTVDPDLYLYAHGLADVWSNQSWGLCDYILGVENITKKHWFAFRYNFLSRTVEIYDSMSGSFTKERKEVADRHAIIAPSLYNINKDNDAEMLDPDVPFDVEYKADVPQQNNGYDCGVFAIKIVQCLAMQDDYTKLEHEHFKDYRKKLACDLVRWQKMPGGKLSLDEKAM